MKKTREEIKYWEKRNKELALEYKTACPGRRGEIFSEYYEGNKFFLTYWGRWKREHWGELTQIFVSYWHEAFMGYNPTSEQSVFNFYMDRKYKAKASMAYKQWIKHEHHLALEFGSDDSDRQEEKRTRKELYIHPQSDWDRAVLRGRLSRNLDSSESKILDEYFFGDRKREEIRKEYEVTSPTGFLKRYEKMLDKLVLNVSKQELYELASMRQDVHPLNIIGKKTKTETRIRIGGRRVKAAA